MDWYKFLIGVSFILLGIILLIIEIKDKGYKSLNNWADIMLLFGGIFSLIGGISYIVESF